MKKAKVLSALMVTAMLMGAAGCSNNEAKDTKETTQETEVEATAESSEGTVVETIEANNTVVDDDRRNDPWYGDSPSLHIGRSEGPGF